MTGRCLCSFCGNKILVGDYIGTLSLRNFGGGGGEEDEESRRRASISTTTSSSSSSSRQDEDPRKRNMCLRCTWNAADFILKEREVARRRAMEMFGVVPKPEVEGTGNDEGRAIPFIDIENDDEGRKNGKKKKVTLGSNDIDMSSSVNEETVAGIQAPRRNDNENLTAPIVDVENGPRSPQVQKQKHPGTKAGLGNSAKQSFSHSKARPSPKQPIHGTHSKDSRKHRVPNYNLRTVGTQSIKIKAKAEASALKEKKEADDRLEAHMKMEDAAKAVFGPKKKNSKPKTSTSSVRMQHSFVRKAKPMLGQLKESKSKSNKKREEIQNKVALPILENKSAGLECNQCRNGRFYSNQYNLQSHKDNWCKAKPTRTPFGYAIPVIGKGKQLKMKKTSPN